MQKSLNLNPQQKKVADDFIEFLLSDEKELIITGSAGTGKTFLMKYLCDTVYTNYVQACKLINMPITYQAYAFTATTHKAASVLAHTLNKDVQTIHSFLGLTIINDYKTGETCLKPAKGYLIQKYNYIVFIDEASMINKDLYSYIEKCLINCKIVYVGDKYQLAPVKESISPIFKKNIKTVTLTQIMRNANQVALQQLCDQLRQTVITGFFNPIKTVPGVIDWVTGSEMKKEIDTNFNQPINDKKILAYTNTTTIEYNNYIRSLRNYKDVFTVGEYLISNSTYRDVTGKCLITNDETVKVKKILAEGKIQSVHGNSIYDVPITRLEVENSRGEFIHIDAIANLDKFKILLKILAKEKNWQLYFRYKENYIDLRKSDAITIHKSQGATYDTVYIDVDDLSTCFNPKMAARLLYVAVTRAKKRVVFYGNLSEKYGGIIQV